MKIIDAHIHTGFSYPPAQAFAAAHGIDFSWKGLQRELDKNGIETALAITTDPQAPTPGDADSLIEQARKDSRLRPVCTVHPDHVGQKDRQAVDRLMGEKKIAGIKIFPGYHPVYPSDRRYFPFYRLAAGHGVPVIIHTGDTFGSHYGVKYAHPLAIDEIAIAFPDTRFVIAHLGNPWVRDASEVVYKNENVYADLSAFCIGCIKKSPRYVVDDIRYALDYTGRPDKFMYGSDWPLIDMAGYIRIVKHAVPREHHKLVFYENAKKIFGI